MKFFNKYTPQELFNKFGIISVHFYPYEDNSYLLDTENIENIKQSLKEYLYSTIFEDYRYFFKDEKSLEYFIKNIINKEINKC